MCENMGVNRYQPHIHVLPEDDRDRQLANGFLLRLLTRQVQVLDVAGGWRRVLEVFESEHVSELRRNPQRNMILLIDFDGKDDRLAQCKEKIPKELENRVFVLGPWTTPEDLRRGGRGSTYEEIGKAMAEDCLSGINGLWASELLQHNIGELTRLRGSVCTNL